MFAELYCQQSQRKEIILVMDYQAKIKAVQQKIQAYQAQYPQRDREQEHKLSALWLELVYWQLAAKGEIKPDPLFFKAQEF
jgi:hypothetical protein